MQYWLITNQVQQARAAVQAGVGRIFIDLELHGKAERQAGRDTHISVHQMTDITPMRSALPDVELMVRINPIYVDSESEIKQVIDAGADWIMLPMITDVTQVETLLDCVQGRVKVVLLIETPHSVATLEQICAMPGVDEIFIGLNDLHLAMGHRFMFQIVAEGLLDQMVETIKAAGLPFGFGGIARIGEGLVPAEMVLSEHMRLGSTRVILSRTLFQSLPEGIKFATSIAQEMSKLQRVEQQLLQRDQAQTQTDQRAFQDAVHQVVTTLEVQ